MVFLPVRDLKTRRIRAAPATDGRLRPHIS
jgi:hypothetical protein